MKSRDYLIWIGESYSKVLCGLKKSTCAIPFNHGSSHCYIHEAEFRGCCRKVPQIPQMAITGSTRIFLAHKDGLHKKEQGRIFGYYVLGSIEQIKGVKQSINLPTQNIRNSKTPHGIVSKGEGWNGQIIETSKILDERFPKLEPPLPCKENAVREKKCGDGSVIITHQCINGEWVKTDEDCDDNGIDNECEDGNVKFLFCDDATLISHICINGEWVETGAECPVNNSPEQTMFETERACSLRLKPGSIYLVDALTRDITKEFRINLEKEDLKKRYIDAKTEAEKENIIARGRKLFINTVADVKKKRKICTVIPEVIKDKAEIRGELVYFKNRTIFEKFPSAPFLGILSVDGDKIIEQIAEGKPKIEIFYCDENWMSRLAQTTKSNKTHVKSFIDHLIEIIKEELKNNEQFSIPGLGKFYILETKKKQGINPNTREKITIPPKKRVKFKAYKNLKEYNSIHTGGNRLKQP